MLPYRNALPRLVMMSLLSASLLISPPALAQDDDNGDEAEETDDNLPATMRPPPQTPPQLSTPASAKVTIDFVDAPLSDVVQYFARITGRNFILTDDLKGDVTIISHKQVTVAEAYEAFLSALETAGYTTVTVGGMTKIVSHGEAGNNPLRVYEDGNIPYTDNFVTQIIQLENVSVSDISSVVKDLGGKSAKVIAYAPTNTLIITDSAVNIRRVYRIISQLDVEAPKARLEIIPLEHATASEVEKIIEELYGSAETSSSSSSNNNSSSSSRSSRNNRRNRNRNRNNDSASSGSSGASSTTVGSEGKYIEKIISDERTNSLIIMANEEAMAAVRKLIDDIDVDVDPTKYAQLHVIYLEHAKAEDVAQVLSKLSEASSSSSSSRNNRNTNNSRRGGRTNESSRRGSESRTPDADATSSAVAAFDSGVRITSDENTNSLVIIATPDQMTILQSVIDKLDIVRKQVFVEAVIMELASEDSGEVGLGVHMGNATGDETDPTISLLSGQLGGSSLGLSQDLLTGMALGVFGPSITTSVSDGLGGTTDLTIPAFGVVLNAIQSNSSTNILSTPNILTMDNEEAKIVVGRNIPFPVSNSFNANGQPVISYQREDVAITLKVTPQINESDFVTLQVFQEVQEVEEDSSGLDVSSAGFITSKRSVETTVVIRDNQTVVLGGLMGSTDTEVETKVPVLGDLPLLGRLFRGTRTTSRKTNLLVFLTPHVVNEPADMEEIYRIKVAQRQEFLRRFYGKSREEQEQALAELLQYSMNQVDQPSLYRGSSDSDTIYIESESSSSSSVESAESGAAGIGGTSPASTPGRPPSPTPADIEGDAIPADEDATPEEATDEE